MFCAAWRDALRRILRLPYNAHSYFLLTLSDTLPVYDETRKRSMKFIATSSVSSSQQVQIIAHNCVMFGRFISFLGKDALLYCDRYNWLLTKCINNTGDNNYFSFECFHVISLSDIQKIIAGFVSDLMARQSEIVNYSYLNCSSLTNGPMTLLNTCAKPDFQFTHFFGIVCTFQISVFITCIGFMYLKYEGI